METVNREKLVDDVKTVLNDVELLMKQAASASGQQAADLRERASDALERVRGKLDHLQRSAIETGRQAARDADHWVHDNPWSSIGAAAALGLLIGVLVARR